MTQHKLQGSLISRLNCGACRGLVTVPRPEFKERERGHIKDMHCPYCEEDRPFIEKTVYSKTDVHWELVALDQAIDLKRALKLRTEVFNKKTNKFLTSNEKNDLINLIKLEHKTAQEIIEELEQTGYITHILKFKKN